MNVVFGQLLRYYIIRFEMLYSYYFLRIYWQKLFSPCETIELHHVWRWRSSSLWQRLRWVHSQVLEPKETTRQVTTPGLTPTSIIFNHASQLLAKQDTSESVMVKCEGSVSVSWALCRSQHDDLLIPVWRSACWEQRCTIDVPRLGFAPWINV